jgi:hypothetical protein
LEPGPFEHPCLDVLNKVKWNVTPTHTSEPFTKPFNQHYLTPSEPYGLQIRMRRVGLSPFLMSVCGPCDCSIDLAFKPAGTLRQIETLLAAPWQVNRFMTHHENGTPLATWAFACRYHLKSVLESVEAALLGDPHQMLRTREEAAGYAASLPASSVDVGCGSLMPMLHSVTVNCPKEVQAVTALQHWKDELRETVVYSKHRYRYKSGMLNAIDKLFHLQL